jgi:probable F420-dependent oxidoreductase
MQIGAWIGNNGVATPEHMLAVARASEDHGLASIWAADHVVWPVDYDSKYPYGGDKYPADENQPVCEATTTMAWLSAHTRRVRIGSLVLVVPQRNPWLLGKQLATIDLLNGGRTVLGAGMGWLREEFDVLGEPFDDRLARGREAIELMRAMWTRHPLRFEGRFWKAPPVGVLPQPVQRPIPVWLGGNTEGAQRRAGRQADGWLPYGLSPAELRAGWDGVRRAAEAAGRDPAALTCALWTPIALTSPGDPRLPPEIFLQGSAEELVEKLGEYAKGGLEHFLMYNVAAPEAVAEQIARIGDEVLPGVADLRPAKG